MLPGPTMEKLKELRLFGMLQGLEEQLSSSQYSKLSFEERLGLMIDREVLDRGNNRLSSRLKKANLRHKGCMEDINYSHPRKLDRNQLTSLAKCKWVKEHRNILITGPTGIGKSYIACALAHKACLEGFTSNYFRSTRLFSELVVAKGDGRYLKIINSLAKVDVLIIDDWGLSKLAEQEKKDFLEIMEDRHDLKSIIVTSQIPINKWHGVIGDSTIADAILDRLIHNSYRIELEGDSLRKMQNKFKNTEKSDEEAKK